MMCDGGTGWATQRRRGAHLRWTVFTGCQMGGGGPVCSTDILSPVFVLERPRSQCKVYKQACISSIGRVSVGEDSRRRTHRRNRSRKPFLSFPFLLFIPLLWLLPLWRVSANSHVNEIVTDLASTSVVDIGAPWNSLSIRKWMMDESQIEILDKIFRYFNFIIWINK